MKKLSKKIIVLLLIIIVIISIIAVGSVNAAQKGTISVASVSADVNETVDVDITVSDNPGIMGMTLTVNYDQEAIELISVKDAGILGSQSHKNEKTSPYTLAWSDDTATTNNISNGVIVTLTFKVTDKAEKGSIYPIEISYDYDNYDIYDTDMNPVQFSLQNGYIKMPEIPSVHSHNLTKIEAKSSTCKAQGNNEYYYCEGCDTYFKDAEAKNVTSVDAEKLPLAAHDYVENATNEYLKSDATCTKYAVYYKSCSVCEEKSDETFTYGELKEHEYSEDWKYDPNGHWHECKNCGDKHLEEAHISNGAATEEKAEICTVCGYVISPSLDHTHNLKIIKGKDATCTAEGQKAYYICEGCGKWYEDGTASIEITDKNSVLIPMIPHISGEWIIDKAASQTEKGSRHKECIICGQIMETEEILVVPTQPVATETTVSTETTVPTETAVPTETTTSAETTSQSETTSPTDAISSTVVANESKSTNDSVPNTSYQSKTNNNSTSNNGGAVQTGQAGLTFAVVIILLSAGMLVAYITYRKRSR